MRLCWMLFAFVGNILPCYKNYFMYVNSLMSLSLFTKETTDVEMWLRFTRTRNLCNWRSKFPSFHQECECTLAACKQKQQQQYWLQLFCKSTNSLKSHINYLDMLQCFNVPTWRLELSCQTDEPHILLMQNRTSEFLVSDSGAKIRYHVKSGNWLIFHKG